MDKLVLYIYKKKKHKYCSPCLFDGFLLFLLKSLQTC